MRHAFCLFGTVAITFAFVAQTLLASPLQLDVAVEDVRGKLICTASVTNVSHQQIELASIRKVYAAAAPYKSGDTYWSSTIERDGGVWPVYYGHAYFAGKEPYRLSSAPKEQFDRIADDPSFPSAALPPGATQKLLIRHLIPDKPTSVVLKFLVKSGGQFHIEEVQWKEK